MSSNTENTLEKKDCGNCAFWDRAKKEKAFGCGPKFTALIGYDIVTKEVAPCKYVVNQQADVNLGFADNFGCKCFEKPE